MAKPLKLVVLGVAAVLAVGFIRDQGVADAEPPHSAPGRFVKPVAGQVSSGFGARDGGFHYGLDIAAPLGTPIRAVTRGEVIEAGPATGFGLWMRLEHPDGTVTVYGHMNTINQPVGAHVVAGERIATVGARGQATGPHLHLEVWPHGDRDQRVNPKTWLSSHGTDY